MRFEQQVTAGELRDALGGAEAPPITQFGSENEFVIRAPLAEDASITEVAEKIESDVTANLPNSGVEVVRTELVGAKVGGELQTKALLAVLLSFLLTLVYIAFRFELRFGLAAVIATAHDILITLGFLAAFRTEISLPTVAAILTILGYSLNDTIVVFDRVRENMKAKAPHLIFVFHDSFKFSGLIWNRLFDDDDMENVVMDTHQYMFFWPKLFTIGEYSEAFNLLMT